MKDQTWLAGTARERIQDLAKAKKVSQVKLAEATGINRSKISRFISGASDSLSHEDIIKIAHYFKVSTDFLLGETDVPDRKNYDIEELGLSVKAAKRLYTGIVNPQIVCQLLEHEKCPELMQKIEMFQEGIEAAGIAAQNQVYDSLRNSAAEHAKKVPEDKEAAINTAIRLKAMTEPTHALELEGIKQLLFQIITDIRTTGPDRERSARIATKEVMAEMIETTVKGSEGKDLRQEMPEIIMNKILSDLPEKMNIALMSAPEELKPEAERVMLRIREDIRDYLTLIKKAQQETPNDK